MKQRQYKSEISGVIHEMATALHEIDVIDKTTMRRFDKSCLTEIEPLDGTAIRAIPNYPRHPRTGSPITGCFCRVSEYQQKPSFRMGARH